MAKLAAILVALIMTTCSSLGICDAAVEGAASTAANGIEAAADRTAAEHVAPQPGDPVTLESDFGLMVGGEWYPMLVDVAPLIEALGEPEDIVLTERGTDADVCDREYVYPFGSVYTYADGESNIWYETFIDGENQPTVRGIQIGDTRADVIKAYGEAYFEEGSNVIIYNTSGVEGDYNNPCVLIEIVKGGVIYMDIFNPIYDTHVDDELAD